MTRRHAARAAAIAATLLLAAGACGDDDEDDGSARSTSSSTTTTPSTSTDAPPTTTAAISPSTGGTTPLAPTTPARPLADIALATQQVAVLDAPIALATRPGTGDLYVAEKPGRVRRLTAGGADPVVDISGEVLDQGEQGLLGLAFSPDGRVLYLDFIHRADASTRVIALELDGAGSAGARRELLRVEQPYPNHNGGQLATGPDGYLYIGLGDGGSGGDPHGHGQDTGTLLGSILRIDPGAGQTYGIPPGNPFADGGGRPEIWLFGVRNPWRFSFDRATDDLWVADVGQGEVEEVDHLRASNGRDAGRGANLGWNLLEGSRSYEGQNPPGGVLPVHEYSHDDGCSITGGYVYRGAAIPALAGAYLFADYCEPGLRGIRVQGSATSEGRTWALDLGGVQSFGEDAAGEVYVLLASGPVLRIVPG